MKLLASLLVIVLTAVANFSQEPEKKPAPTEKRSANPEVERELNQTASLYRTGDFAEAQWHAERAASLEPANKTAAIFLARVRHQRYEPGNDQPQNLAVARAAIDAYQAVLTLDAQNEEAYKAIAVLYAATHQDELLKAWVLQRATNPQISNQKRAEAYTIVAGKDWDCSYRFTEMPDHKVTQSDGKKDSIAYKIGNDVVEFQRIKQCVTTGLEMAEAALLLDYESESAWSYKANLFLESAKLAGMEGLDLAKVNYLKQAKEAQTQAAKLVEQRRSAEESDLEILPRELPPPPAAGPSPSPRKP
jgi:hypothetical protein